MSQQLGFFDVKDPSGCDKPNDPNMGKYATPVFFLSYGAVNCCKSQKVDQTVCKVDKCLSGVSKCFGQHVTEVEAIEEQLKDAKAMEMNEEGDMEGNCLTALFNRVEGALCCSTAMDKMTGCISKEVGDYRMCRDVWDKAYGPDHFKKAEAAIQSFKAGGYCTSFTPRPEATLASTSAAKALGCVKCATFKPGSGMAGVRSCCAPGGAWFDKCGAPGDSKFEHSWFEGAQACTGAIPSTPSPAIPTMPLPCEQASDFDGDNEFGGGQTCESLAGVLLPRSAAECDESLGDGAETKGQMLKHMYSMCCKPGSKPNGICGLKLNTATPCENKADGEFMPEAK